VEVDATPPSPVGTVSFGMSPDVISGGDHVASLNVEQVEDVEVFAVTETKMNLRKWVKKHESLVS